MQENTNTNTFSGNIDFLSLRKKKFTIDGDENKVIELNTSDMGIITRVSEKYKLLIDLASSIGDLKDLDPNSETATDDLIEFSNALLDTDSKMRAIIDEIFDSNVSEVVAPFGSMYDPIDGEFRFEIIVSGLLKLYGETISRETQKIQDRVKQHTNKYLKK